jgi:hypothetical protein
MSAWLHRSLNNQCLNLFEHTRHFEHVLYKSPMLTCPPTWPKREVTPAQCMLYETTLFYQLSRLLHYSDCGSIMVAVKVFTLLRVERFYLFLSIYTVKFLHLDFQHFWKNLNSKGNHPCRGSGLYQDGCAMMNMHVVYKCLSTARWGGICQLLIVFSAWIQLWSQNVDVRMMKVQLICTAVVSLNILKTCVTDLDLNWFKLKCIFNWHYLWIGNFNMNFF